MRVPNKAFLEVGGKTLLEIAVRQAQEVFANVVVSSDSQPILQMARELGAEVVNRPGKLATDRASKWDVFKHLATQIECTRIVDLDVGCPFRSQEDISICAQMLADHDIVQTAYVADRNPYFNMVMPDGVVILPRGVVNSQDAPIVYSLSPAVFAFKVAVLEQYAHWSEYPMGLHIIPRDRAWDIDTPFDALVAKLLAERKA